MEAANDEGESVEQHLDGGEQKGLTDPLHRGHDFKLRDRLSRIDMIDPFVPIEISLVDRIDAQVTRLALRLGLRRSPMAMCTAAVLLQCRRRWV